MADQSISFSIEGEITLDTLCDSMEALKRLLRQLTSEIVPGSNIRWVVDELQAASLHTTFRGDAVGDSSTEDVTKVAKQYAAIGEAVAHGDDLPCAAEVVEAVEELLSAAQQDGSEAVFTADGKTSRVDLRTWNRKLATGRSRAIGSVTGVIKGINGSGQPYICIYEREGGAAVRCYVNEEQLRWALSAWGATVYVQGRLTRERSSRRKREIRQIINYRVVFGKRTGRFEEAFGVGEWQVGDPSSVQLIRAIRDEA